MTSGGEADTPVTEQEMTLAELDERLTALEAAVKENTGRIETHSKIGWTIFILWLLGFIGSLIWLALVLRIAGWHP